MSDISFVYLSGTLDREMKPPDARRNGRTQELRDSCSLARGAQR